MVFDGWVIALLAVLLGICVFGVRIISLFSYNRFIRIGFSLILTIFAVITFIFSLHGNVFSQYDKPDRKHSEFYWFFPSHIVEYPVSQLRYHEENFLNQVNVSEFNPDTLEKNFVFVIDKSLSTNLARQLKDRAKSFRKQIEERIKRNPTACAPLDRNLSYIKDLDAADLMLIGLIEQLYMLYDHSPALKEQIHISVVIYNGEKEIPQPMDELEMLYIDFTLSDDICFFLNGYQQLISKLRNAPRANRNTNFEKIMREIQSPRYNNPSAANIITLISDFYHEDKTASFTAFEKSVLEFSHTTYEHLNLIKLKESEKNSEQDIERTIRLIKKYCKFILCNEYEHETILLAEESDKTQCYISFIMQTDYGNKRNSELNFYHPHTYGKFNHVKKASIRFGQSGLYVLNIMNESMQEQDLYLKLVPLKKEWERPGKPLVVVSNNPVLHHIKHENYEMIFEGTDIPHNTYLEIYHQDRQTKVRLPLVFNELLPKTACYLLILSYTTYMVLIFGFVIFLSFLLKTKSILYERKKIVVVPGIVRLLIFLALLTVFAVLLQFFFKLASGLSGTSFIGPWIGYSTLLFILLVAVLMYEYKHFTSYEK